MTRPTPVGAHDRVPLQTPWQGEEHILCSARNWRLVGIYLAILAIKQVTDKYRT